MSTQWVDDMTCGSYSMPAVNPRNHAEIHLITELHLFLCAHLCCWSMLQHHQTQTRRYNCWQNWRFQQWIQQQKQQGTTGDGSMHVSSLKSKLLYSMTKAWCANYTQSAPHKIIHIIWYSSQIIYHSTIQYRVCNLKKNADNVRSWESENSCKIIDSIRFWGSDTNLMEKWYRQILAISMR